MTDTAPSKPMWKRHKACNQRVFNDPIDWDGHVRACPAVLRADLDRFIKRFDALDIDERLDALEQTETTDVHDVDEDDEDADQQPSTYLHDAAQQPDIDEDDDEIVERPPLSVGYVPGTTDAYGRPIQ